MFEQSMLFDSPPGKRAGALAVSLTMQSLALGTLFLVPLIYTERLSFMQPSLPVFLPTFRPPEPPKQEPVQARPTQVFAAASVFRAPTVIRSLSEIQNVEIAPPSDSSIHTEGLPMAAPMALPMIRVLPPPPPVQAVAIEKAPDHPIQVGGEVQAAKLIRKITPVYPRLAMMVRVSGTVRLIGTVAKDGTIQQLQVVSGHPMLVNAALDAVRQWLYSPTLLNGKPVEVTAPIDVIFSLAQ